MKRSFIKKFFATVERRETRLKIAKISWLGIGIAVIVYAIVFAAYLANRDNPTPSRNPDCDPGIFAYIPPGDPIDCPGLLPENVRAAGVLRADILALTKRANNSGCEAIDRALIDELHEVNERYEAAVLADRAYFDAAMGQLRAAVNTKLDVCPPYQLTVVKV